MQDLQLYQQLLGLSEPWYVTGVRLDVKTQEVEVTVAVRDQLWGCPQCASRMHVHQWEKRTWRHLDSCQFKTLIRADVPVVRGGGAAGRTGRGQRLRHGSIRTSSMFHAAGRLRWLNVTVTYWRPEASRMSGSMIRGEGCQPNAAPSMS